MDKKAPLIIQTKALLIHAPGVGVIIQTGDGQRMALSAGLAEDIANQILVQTQAGPIPESKSPYLQ